MGRPPGYHRRQHLSVFRQRGVAARQEGFCLHWCRRALCLAERLKREMKESLASWSDTMPYVPVFAGGEEVLKPWLLSHSLSSPVGADGVLPAHRCGVHVYQ